MSSICYRPAFVQILYPSTLLPFRRDIKHFVPLFSIITPNHNTITNVERRADGFTIFSNPE